MDVFKVIVAGGRDFSDYRLMHETLDRLLKSKSKTHKVAIISGTARGADTEGEEYAHDVGIDCIQMPADWNTHGKSAGYKRNHAMAEIADAAVVFWDGKSRGSKHMIDIAKAKGLPLRVVYY
jgi:hypothetical protein